MLKRGLIAIGLLCGSLVVAYAQSSFNGHQAFQPAKVNYVSRSNTPPDDPTNATATDVITGGSFLVQWTDNSNNETGFELYVNINGGGFNLVETTAAGVTSTNYNNPVVSSSYVFRVRAINLIGNSGYATASAVVHAVPIFRADFSDGSITPQTGPAATFNRASTRYYQSSTSETGIAVKSSGQAAVEAFSFRGAESDGGVQIMGARKNWLLRSEEFDNAVWTAVGTGAVVADQATSPDNAATADRLDGTLANDGIVQDSGVVAGDTTVVFSVYVKRVGGSDIAGKLTLAGTGGSPGTQTQAFTATNAWQRVVMTGTFGGSITGNTTAAISVDNALTSIYIWGAMLSYWNVGANAEKHEGGTVYVKTTSAVAATVVDNLQYDSSLWTTQALTTGSSSLWVKLPYAGNTVTSSMYLFNSGNNLIGAQVTNGNGRVRNIYNGGVTCTGTTALAANTWYNVVYTWFQTGTSVTAFIYLNGVQECTGTASKNAVGAGTLYIGNQNDTGSDANIDAIISRKKIFEIVLTGTDAATIYNAEKANYGL